MATEKEKSERRMVFLIAEANARRFLKPGDRIRVTKCPGKKRWATFAGWDDHWIVSKSGINGYAPGCVDMVNDLPVDFTELEPAVIRQPGTKSLIVRYKNGRLVSIG